MREETNQALAKLPIELLTPDFKHSMKHKSITYALEYLKEGIDKVVILDADNLTDTDFLTRVNDITQDNIAHVSYTNLDVYKRQERMLEIQRRVTEGRTPGIHTGLEGLDRMTGGMMPGTLNVIAARPRVGKTAFALFMALNAARNGHPVCLYSLEMSKEQLVFRLLGCIADIEPSKILKGTLSDPEMKTMCIRDRDYSYRGVP